MSQSTLIVGAIFVAWIVWVTLHGELSTYLGILFGAGSATTGTGTGTGPSSGTASNSYVGLPAGLLPFQSFTNNPFANLTGNPSNLQPGQ
jgi:hypothetical protein